jgi:general secretion pathway protein B
MAAPPSDVRRSTPPAFPVSSEESPTLPSRDDLLAAGAAIPEANLNMHVYDASPALRFVLLNGQRLREGEVSREGLRVEQILPSGVLLSTGGTSFMLSIN